MYKLLVRLMAIAALAEFGMSTTDLKGLNSRRFIHEIELRSLKVLRIDWKPLTIFPEEAKHFRKR